MEQTRGLFCTSITSGEELDVRRVFRGQVGLAAVNQMCVIHEAMSDCKNLKIH